MLIEVGSPASLPLGLVRFDTGQISLLGLTVQHPPTQIFAQSHPTLQMIGARADLARRHATHFLHHHHLKQQAGVEIELAIPMLVGLGSDPLLGLSLAHALAWVHNLPADQYDPVQLARALGLSPDEALAVFGFDQGGLLLVDSPPEPGQEFPALRRRAEIAHREKEAWAFVFHFPDLPPDTPETLEQDRLAALWQAAPHLSDETGHLVDTRLWPAVETDDFETFARALARLHDLNLAALKQAGTSPPLSAGDQAILEVMRQSGAAGTAQTLTGLSAYGLIQGGQPSRILRKKLRDHVGFFGGTILATITANAGVRQAEHKRNLAFKELKSPRLNLRK